MGKFLVIVALELQIKIANCTFNLPRINLTLLKHQSYLIGFEKSPDGLEPIRMFKIQCTD